MRVLVVEDDVSLNDTLSDLLCDDGHEVVQAHNGREAADALRARKPDAMVLDYMLPILAADGLLYMLAPELEGVRVVILTGSEAEIPDSLHGVPIAALLHKPGDFDAVPVALGYKSRADLEAERRALDERVREDGRT